MKEAQKSSNGNKERFREMILARKNQILDELRKLSDGLGSSAELKPLLGSDLGDLSMLNLDSELNISLADRYAALLKQIEDALLRVEEGTFGHCEECDEEIDERRLEIVPFALYCTRCQKKLEEENKRRPRSSPAYE